MGGAFFREVSEPIRFEGLDSTNPLAFKVYDPDRIVLGKRMEGHLRPARCFWHSFAWTGLGMFGVGTHMGSSRDDFVRDLLARPEGFEPPTY